MEDVYCNILSYLSIKDIVRYGLVSKLFNDITKWEILWKDIFNLHFYDTKIMGKNYYETCKLNIQLRKLRIDICYKGTCVKLYKERRIELYNNKFQFDKWGSQSDNDSQLDDDNSQLDDNDSQLDNCKILLDNKGFTIIQTEIGLLTNLTELDLDCNNIFDIPTEIGNLCNLKYLDLKYNNIINIPSEIYVLTNLVSLELEDNKIVNIPSKLVNLLNLQTLNLSHNTLLSLPTEIGGLCNLRTLNLNNNDTLLSLPSELGNLNNLRVFNLDDNLYNFVPSGLDKCKIKYFLNGKTNRVPLALAESYDLKSRLWGKNLHITVPVHFKMRKMHIYFIDECGDFIDGINCEDED
jgi:hypothetical protein